MKVASISLCALASIFSMASVAHGQTFDGPSAGVQGGWVENSLRNPKTDLGVISIDQSKDSAILGGFIAYDKTFGKVVIGAEAGMNLATSDVMSGSSSIASVTVDPKWSFDLTARAGYLVAPKTLVYGRGGYSNGRVRTTLTSATGTTAASDSHDGWLVGGGIERMVTPNVSARVEYRYSDLSGGDGKFDRHQTLLGITYRF